MLIRLICWIFWHKRWKCRPGHKGCKRYLRWLHKFEDINWLDPNHELINPFEHQYICGRCGEDLPE